MKENEWTSENTMSAIIYVILIVVVFVLATCSSVSNVDDTEHLWRGGNGETFYE